MQALTEHAFRLFNMYPDAGQTGVLTKKRSRCTRSIYGVIINISCLRYFLYREGKKSNLCCTYVYNLRIHVHMCKRVSLIHTCILLNEQIYLQYFYNV